MAKLTPEEARVDNAFRRLNRRLQTAYNSLGPDSEVYAKLESYATSLGVRGATVKMDKNGVPYVVRDKASLTNLSKSNISVNINTWLDSHTDTKTTVSNIRAQLKAKNPGLKISKGMIKARAAAERQAKETIHQNLALLYEYEHQAEFIDDILSDWAKGTGRKTYDDIVALAEAADKLKKQISQGSIQQAPPKSPFD